MSDAGYIYAQMGANLGRQISGAMEDYHKEHQAYDQQAGIADVLSRFGVNAQGTTHTD